MPNIADNMGKADLHIHTTASDGFFPVDQVLDHIAQHTDLNVIAITDHDEIEASLWAYQHRNRYPFEIVPGLEVSSRDGHVLALWVTRPVAPDMSLAATVAAIHEQGGTAVLAHPFEFYIQFGAARQYLAHPEMIRDARVDAIEVHNGGAFSPFANTLARRTALSLRMPTLSNSDAHSTAAIGAGITRFKGHSADDLRHAILSGQTIAEKGRRWPLADYLRLFPRSLMHKLHLLPEPGAAAADPARNSSV